MTKRRKFLAGLGALASGSAAAVGTGALTSTTLEDRNMTAQVTADSGSMVGLEAGDLPSAGTTSSGALQLDLSGDEGEGINIDSVYTWGDHDNPSESHAFKIVNNDEQDFGSVVFEYDVTPNDEWVEDGYGPDQSFLRFTAYNIGGYAETPVRAPNYNASMGDREPYSRNMLGPHGAEFGSGDVWYVVVDADTTGPNASDADDLTGELSISVSDPVE